MLQMLSDKQKNKNKSTSKNNGYLGNMPSLNIFKPKRTYRKNYTKFLFQFLFFMIILVTAAAIFQVVETEFRPRLYPEPLKHIIPFVEDDVLHEFSEKHNISVYELYTLLSLNISRNNISAIKNNGSEANETIVDLSVSDGISYMEGLMLTVSIFTTIGWGNVYPVTVYGRIFAVVMTFIGIPLTFIMVITGGNIIIKHLTDLIRMVHSADKYKVGNSTNGYLSPGLVILLFIYFLLTSAFLALAEDWSYHDSLWYCFTALSTIGFGDLYQKKMIKEHQVGYKTLEILFTLVWLIIGFSNVAAIFISLMSSSSVKHKDGGHHHDKNETKEDNNEIHFKNNNGFSNQEENDENTTAVHSNFNGSINSSMDKSSNGSRWTEVFGFNSSDSQITEANLKFMSPPL